MTTGIGIWTITDWPGAPGPNPTIIDSPNNHQTSLSNIQLGTYELTWTVSNGPFTIGSCAPQTDTVSITFNEVPPTNANAGPDQLLCSETQTNLAADPVTSGIGMWSQTAGPIGASIASPSNPTSVLFGLVTGVYEFTWTTSTTGNNGCIFTDTVEIEIIEQPTIVNAGPNQCLSLIHI